MFANMLDFVTLGVKSFTEAYCIAVVIELNYKLRSFMYLLCRLVWKSLKRKLRKCMGY